MRVRTCLISLGAIVVAGAVLIAAWTGGRPPRRIASPTSAPTPCRSTSSW